MEPIHSIIVCVISLTINVPENESPTLIKLNVNFMKEKGVIKFKVENTFKIYCFSLYEYGEEYQTLSSN
jgi:hypothetical protein